MRRTLAALLTAAALLLASGCSDNSMDEAGSSAGGARFPDVVDVEITADGDGTYALEITISSTYDTPERYADGWRVLDPDGEELGVMELTHDHASEQPFTRTHSGLEIPDGVTSVTVEGHDQANGYGGATQTVDVPAG